MTIQDYMLDRIGQVCHEANRSIQIISGDMHISSSWEKTPLDVRESTKRGVRAMLAEPRTPEEMHRLWMEDKLLHGWEFGHTKDHAAKTHPCLRPYEELPEGQRLKDRVFIAIVNAFREHAEAEGLFGL